MRIAFYVPKWKRHHGGAHWAMLRIADGFRARNHTVRLYHDEDPVRRPYGKVERWPGGHRFDVVMCAGGMPDERFSTRHGLIVRNVHHSTIAHWSPYGNADGIIYCSETYRKHFQARGVSSSTPSMVSYPIVDPDSFRTQPGKSVTLINPMPEKGGDLFYELAASMPDIQFLAVQGGWNKKSQIQPEAEHGNVTWLPFQADARQVYKRTQILLYPLGQHAPADWIDGAPMSPVEAACAGIPTIATPQPGMVEVMGQYGYFVEGYELSAWQAAIRDVWANWGKWSAKAKAKAATLNPDSELDRIEQFLRSL